MVVKLVGTKKLNIYRGRHAVMMNIYEKANKNLIRENELSKKVNKVSKDLWTDQQNKNYQYQMAVTLKDPAGWTLSYFFPVENNLNYDPTEKQYNYETGELIRTYEPVTRFDIYVVKIDIAGGCGEWNDCLYLCVRDFCNENNIQIKKKYKYAYRLKNILGLKRNDKINVKYIDDIENFYKINIHVCGDYYRQSKLKYKLKHTLTLKLTNAHYKKVSNKREILRYYEGEELKPLFYYENDGKAYIYNPITKQNKIEDVPKQKIKNGYIYVYENYNKEFNKTCQKIYDDWIELKEETKNNIQIDIFKHYCRVKYTSLYLFNKFSETMTQPDKMDEMEEEWITKATTGALMNSRGYNELNYGVKYDVNSEYGKTMSSNLIIPLQKPTFYKLDELPEKGLKTGIYRCKIKNNNNKDNNLLFRINKYDYYTNKDIISARTLKFDIELLQDGQNAMIYEGKNTTAKTYFGDMMNYLYSLKLKLKGNKQVKLLITQLWGSFFQKRKKIHFTDKLHTNNKIVAMKKIKNKFIVRTEPIANVFKYNRYARFVPFILSHSRMLKAILLKDYVQYLYKIHTDGFILDRRIEKLDNLISDKMGDLKIEGEGKVIIKNAFASAFIK